MTGSREEVWDRVLGESGLGAIPDGKVASTAEPGPVAGAAGQDGVQEPGKPQRPHPGTGDAFRFVLDGGEMLEGTVVLCDRPWAFAGVVSSLNDGVLHVEMEGEGDRWKMGVWLSAYGVEEEQCEEIGVALAKTVSRVFPEDA